MTEDYRDRLTALFNASGISTVDDLIAVRQLAGLEKLPAAIRAFSLTPHRGPVLPKGFWVQQLDAGIATTDTIRLCNEISAFRHDLVAQAMKAPDRAP